MGELVYSQANLFSPIRLGRNTLRHRIILAPLSRLRSSKKEHTPLSLVEEYYVQRASTPGTLLITEATFIAEKGGGHDWVPGIYTDTQIQTWRKITDRVHQRGCFIFCQIWALGRAAQVHTLDEDGNTYVSSSPTPLEGKPRSPQELTKTEIKEYIELFAQAGENAIKAGFDGIEIHGANGYLVDQFIQDVVNKRVDEYGDSIENRSRFALEVVDAISSRIGADRTAIRLSPWSDFQGMKMTDPVPQFTYLINELATRHPDLAYLHLVEPRVSGDDLKKTIVEQETLDFARDIWLKTGQPLLVAGGYKPQDARQHFDDPRHVNDCIVFGRYFISNPDLVHRIEKDLPLNPYDRSSFYLPESATGYVDYPFVDNSNKS